MKILVLQHVPFEDEAFIGVIANEKGHSIKRCQLYSNEPLPNFDSFDSLLVMGGSMNIYEEDLYPFLKTEKKFLKECIAIKKPILGICLGSQLLCDVLGGKVTKNPVKEIGWYQLELGQPIPHPIFKGFDKSIEVFQWHGDTFSIPDGALAFGSSKLCQNQGFVYQDKVIALQYHLETTPKSAKKLIDNSKEEIKNLGFNLDIQEIMSDDSRFHQINKWMRLLFDNWVS